MLQAEAAGGILSATMKSTDRTCTAPGTDAGRTIPLPVLGTASRSTTTIRRSRAAPWRAAVLGLIQVLMIAHIVQWVVTGRTLSPVEPSESMEFVKHGIVNAGAIMFLLALLSTVLLGRWFCGWACHVVLLQDLCGWMLKRVGIRPRPFRARLLMWVPFLLAVYMFIWPAVYRWGVVPISQSLHRLMPEAVPQPLVVAPWTGISFELVTEDFWRTFAGPVVAVPFLLICGFAVVYFLGAKGFCTYGCPYGGFFAPLDRFARGRIRVTDACEGCGHCTAVCTSNVRVHEEVRHFGMVVDPGCMKCMDCVSVCPNDALYFGLGSGAGGARPRAGTPAPVSRWDLSWQEELGIAAVFLFGFFGFRGVYEVVPMLMAVGMAICLAFLAWKSWRMLRDQNVAFHRARLRHRGRLTGTGRLFLAGTIACLALAAHCIVVHALVRAADAADARVMVPRAAIFSPSPQRIDAAAESAARSALSRFALLEPVGSGGIALLPVPSHDIRRAWLHACLHEFEDAERYMRRADRRLGGRDELVRDIAILQSLQVREADAARWLHERTGEAPWFYRSLDLLVSSQTAEGRFDDAIDRLKSAVEQLDTMPVPRRAKAAAAEARLYLLRRLSLLLADHGDPLEAVAVFRRTIEIDPASAPGRALLAWALLRAGDPEGARESMQAALALAPEDAALRDDARRLEEMIASMR